MESHSTNLSGVSGEYSHINSASSIASTPAGKRDTLNPTEHHHNPDPNSSTHSNSYLPQPASVSSSLHRSPTSRPLSARSRSLLLHSNNHHNGASTASASADKVTTPTTRYAVDKDPLLQSVADLQQELYRAQGELARARSRLAATGGEASALQQQLSVVTGERHCNSVELEEVKERLARAQAQWEQARRQAADDGLRVISVTAERDDLSEKVNAAWGRIAALTGRLAEVEAERDALRAAALAMERDGSLTGRGAAAESQKLAVARRELEATLERCAALERQLGNGGGQQQQQQQRMAESFGEAAAAVAAALERVRSVNAHRLLPLERATSTSRNSTGLASPTAVAVTGSGKNQKDYHHYDSVAEEERRSMHLALEELETWQQQHHHPAAAAPGAMASLRPVVRATRACLALFDAIHEDALRLCSAHAAALKDRDGAEEKALRAERESAAARHQQQLLRRALDAAEAAAADKSSAREREGLAFCRSLAAVLGCVEDWSMIKHRVQHLQQREAEWEREAAAARGQLEAARADGEVLVRRVEADHSLAAAARAEETRRLSKEMERLREENAALRLDGDFGAFNASRSAAEHVAVAQHHRQQTAGELNRLRGEHTTLQSAYREALRCIENELEPFADEQERQAKAARQQIAKLSQDKEKLYSIIDVLRGQLRGAEGGASSSNRNGGGGGGVATELRFKMPAAVAGSRNDGGVSSVNASRTAAETTSLAQSPQGAATAANHSSISIIHATISSASTPYRYPRDANASASDTLSPTPHYHQQQQQQMQRLPAVVVMTGLQQPSVSPHSAVSPYRYPSGSTAAAAAAQPRAIPYPEPILKHSTAPSAVASAAGSSSSSSEDGGDQGHDGGTAGLSTPPPLARPGAESGQTHHNHPHPQLQQQQRTPSASSIEAEEALVRSIQQDRREAAYSLGKHRLTAAEIAHANAAAASNNINANDANSAKSSSPRNASDYGNGAPSRLDPNANKFAAEVLGVIDALDKRVTGALQRNSSISSDSGHPGEA